MHNMEQPQYHKLYRTSVLSTILKEEVNSALCTPSGMSSPREWVNIFTSEKELECTGSTSQWMVGRQWCRQPCTVHYSAQSHSHPCANLQPKGICSCSEVWQQAAAKACIREAAARTSTRNMESMMRMCKHVWFQRIQTHLKLSDPPSPVMHVY